MKKMFLLILAAMISFASCSQNDNPAHRRDTATQKLLKKHRIKIAVTGQWAKQNKSLLWEGMELAAEEINSSGGVLGANIELVRFEDNNKVSDGAEIASNITADEQICAVIGHYSSSVSLFTSVIYHYYGVLMLTPFSTNTSLTKQGLPYLFRNISNDDAFGQEAVHFCENRGWNRLMIIYLNNSYCRDLADSVEQHCGEHNIVVPDRVSYEEVYNLNTYTKIAERWKKDYIFDAIFIAGFLPEAAEIVSIFRSAGIDQPIIGSIDFDLPSFFSIGDNIKEDNLYCLSNFNLESTNKAFSDFRKAFIAKYGDEPDWETCQSYDAVKVLAKAIEKAGSVKAEKVAKILKSEEAWDECAGPYNFNETGDIEKKLFIKKAENGKFTVLQD